MQRTLPLLACVSIGLAAALTACGSSSVEVLHTGTGGSGADAASSGGASSGTGGAAPAACKRGIAYGYHSVADLTALSNGIGWWYNWAAKPDNADVAAAYAGLGVEYVPMAWGEASLSALSAEVPADARHLLGFNEPNFGSQANLTPTQAAALWPQIEDFAKQHDLAIVSPAVNFCGGTCNVADPFEWLDQFFAACQGCKVDYIAMHWYACDGGALTWYLQQFESKYTQKLWLTEFSCLDGSDTSEPAQQAYMKAALAILEADPRVERYAWFTGRSDFTSSIDLLGEGGELTPLGQTYVNAPASCKP
ncbi:glycoside hydrolase family protein [Polyangium sp. y55x31]|uniref:glycoside hydrolase family protein n=1 Tax=Polyangium sp. y55x31 TaxID=3042688 RepID=UPI002482E5FC|nr:glycoside hydrolase family protein [Polyangium sp. y55x31]MDI1480732.1 glycoside hydrolase family protein [Polyangium sp. y55x31]